MAETVLRTLYEDRASDVITTLKSRKAIYHRAETFTNVWQSSKQEIMKRVGERNPSSVTNEIVNNALMGKAEEVSYFYDVINELVVEKGYENVHCSKWYDSLVEGIFHETYGFAGMAKWFKLPNSQTAKIIGDEIYYQQNGIMVAQEQKISKERRTQMARALMLSDKKGNENSDFNEVILANGARVTFFNHDMTKPGHDVIIFRKKTVIDLSFGALAKLGTFPLDAVDALENLAKSGANTAIVGQMNSGKTTLANAWELLEDPRLEGVIIEMTDEMPLAEQMPGSPIIQFLLSEQDLRRVQRPLKRTDAAYIVMSEARTPEEFKFLVESALQGTNRCKVTLHATNAWDVPHIIADKILEISRNNYENVLLQVAQAFHLIIHMGIDSEDRSKKRILGIYMTDANRSTFEVKLLKLCEYDIENGIWHWNDKFPQAMEHVCSYENPKAWEKAKEEIAKLSIKYPMQGNTEVLCYGKKG